MFIPSNLISQAELQRQKEDLDYKSQLDKQALQQFLASGQFIQPPVVPHDLLDAAALAPAVIGGGITPVPSPIPQPILPGTGRSDPSFQPERTILPAERPVAGFERQSGDILNKRKPLPAEQPAKDMVRGGIVNDITRKPMPAPGTSQMLGYGSYPEKEKQSGFMNKFKKMKGVLGKK